MVMDTKRKQKRFIRAGVNSRREALTRVKAEALKGNDIVFVRLIKTPAKARSPIGFKFIALFRRKRGPTKPPTRIFGFIPPTRRRKKITR